MTCPTDETLAHLAQGKMSGDQLAALESHLDRCPPCRQMLSAISAGSSPLVRPESAVLAPGERLGRYQIERLLTTGGMGVVYTARDVGLGRRVALKLMRGAFGGEAGRVRLRREAQAMAQLSHPNVASVFELGEVDGRVFLAMELVEGGTLREWMRRPRAWREVVDMFAAAGEGLAAAHRAGLVHRDFKPENVLVGPDGRPRVADFGLSCPETVAEEKGAPSGKLTLTQAGMMLGTPAYMAPEQLRGEPADARSDQYGFCVALYEALLGKRPFPAETLDELRARVEGSLPLPPKGGRVPAHLWAALARGLQPVPSARFSDMEGLLEVLRFPESPKAIEPRRRRWGLTTAVAATAVAMLVMATSSGETVGIGGLAVPLDAWVWASGMLGLWMVWSALRGARQTKLLGAGMALFSLLGLIAGFVSAAEAAASGDPSHGVTMMALAVERAVHIGVVLGCLGLATTAVSLTRLKLPP